MKTQNFHHGDASYSVSRVYAQPSEVVWRYISDSEKLSEWLFPNDFVAEVGSEFRFWSPPQADWDGVLNGQVTELSDKKMLSYTMDAPLLSSQSTLDWQLTEVSQGTSLTIHHSGDKAVIDRFYEILNDQTEQAPQGATDPQNFIKSVETLVASDPVRTTEIVNRYMALFPEKSSEIVDAAMRSGGENFLRLVAHSLLIMVTGRLMQAGSAEAAERATDAPLDDLADGDAEISANEAIDMQAADAHARHAAPAMGQSKHQGTDPNAQNRAESQTVALSMGVVLSGTQTNEIASAPPANQSATTRNEDDIIDETGNQAAQDAAGEVPLSLGFVVSGAPANGFQGAEWRLADLASNVRPLNGSETDGDVNLIPALDGALSVIGPFSRFDASGQRFEADTDEADDEDEDATASSDSPPEGFPEAFTHLEAFDRDTKFQDRANDPNALADVRQKDGDAGANAVVPDQSLPAHSTDAGPQSLSTSFDVFQYEAQSYSVDYVADPEAGYAYRYEAWDTAYTHLFVDYQTQQFSFEYHVSYEQLISYTWDSGYQQAFDLGTSQSTLYLGEYFVFYMNENGHGARYDQLTAVDGHVIGYESHDVSASPLAQYLQSTAEVLVQYQFETYAAADRAITSETETPADMSIQPDALS